MANKANLKTYPKVFIQQQNYGAGYAQVPNGVACNRGIWGKVTHKHFRIWVGLRSLKPRPRGYSKTEICRLLNLDRRNGLRDLEAMELQGLIELDGHFLKVVDPDHGANASPVPEENKETTEQPTTKKEKEEKEEENSQPTVLTTPPTGAVTVEATPRPRKIKHDQPSAAITDGPNPQDLADAWNKATKFKGDEYGYPVVKESVSAEDFTAAVISNLLAHSRRNKDVDPVKLLASVVRYSSGYTETTGKGPAFVIGTTPENDRINGRFDKSWAVYHHKKDLKQQEADRLWEEQRPAREAEAAGEAAHHEKYRKQREEIKDAIYGAYERACLSEEQQPREKDLLLADLKASNSQLNSIGSALVRRDMGVGLYKGHKGCVYKGEVNEDQKHAIQVRIADKLSFNLTLLIEHAPDFLSDDYNAKKTLEHHFNTELDKVLEISPA